MEKVIKLAGHACDIKFITQKTESEAPTVIGKNTSFQL